MSTRDQLAGLVGAAARARGQDFTLLGLLLGGVGDDEAAHGGLLGLPGADDDPVLERLQVHVRASCGRPRRSADDVRSLDAIVSTRRMRVLSSTVTADSAQEQLPDSRVTARARRRRLGSIPAPSGVGPSLRSRHQAVAAIIAPLSVQSSTRREQRPAPAAPGDSADPRPQARVRGHAATDHERRRAGLVGRGEELVDELVDHRLLERRGDVGTAASGWRRTWFTTAVLRPENEKSGSPRIGRGNATARGSPSAASRSIAGPPG